MESVFFNKFAIANYNVSSNDTYPKHVNGFIIAVSLARRVCMEHKDILANAIVSKSVDCALLIELISSSLSAKTSNRPNPSHQKNRKGILYTPPTDDNDYRLFEDVNNQKGIQIFSNKGLPLYKAFKELAQGTLNSPLIVSRNKNRAAGFFLGLMAEKGLLPDNYLELIKDNSLLVSADGKREIPIQSLKNGKSENWPYLTEYELDEDDNNIYSRLVKLLKTLDIEGRFLSHPLPYSTPVRSRTFKR